ncbi:MAG: hypothetical protein KOO62_11265 [candidate division Zixibacteria bacterium]|nr:hypothetical protein [candidate division Zixibacteria bacterium]
MSKLIRNASVGATVYVGDRHVDWDRERQAEQHLAKMFPVVAIMTDADGVKFIPIEEVFKMEKLHNQALANAKEEGRKLGHKAGLSEGLIKAEKVLHQFETAVMDSISQRESLLEEARQNVLELVFQMARKVTYDAIKLDPEVNCEIISGVIDSLVDRSRLKIRVNPDHLPIVEQNIDAFLKGATSIKEISIAPDPRVRYGGCFIETPNGDIDARLESQFEVLEDALLSDREES